MTLEINTSEKDLLYQLLEIAVANGNRIDLKSFDTTPEQYAVAYKLWNKIIRIDTLEDPIIKNPRQPIGQTGRFHKAGRGG